MQVDHTINCIELKNVSFNYEKQIVLEDINLNVHIGDYLGIIGPNGGGKTTLLKIMLGILKPTTGEVRLFGQNIRDFNQWGKIGYVAQKATNFDSNFPATVYEVVAMGRYGKKGLFQPLSFHDKQIIEKSLMQVEMLTYKDRIIGDLSGGQQQRVFIARSLATEPEIIFLDEPTVGVDAAVQDQFYTLLKRLNKQLKITLILVSHDIDVISREATEIACVNKTLAYDDDPKHFLKKNSLKKMYGEGVSFILHKH